MCITYKIIETIYRNGCSWGEQQLFDDTDDLFKALDWYKESYADNFDFSKLPYASYNEYEVWYELDVYDDGEYDYTLKCRIYKGTK